MNKTSAIRVIALLIIPVSTTPYAHGNDCPIASPAQLHATNTIGCTAIATTFLLEPPSGEMWTITPDHSVSAHPSEGIGNATIAVQINTTSLTSGTFNSKLTIDSSSCQIEVPIHWTVNEDTNLLFSTTGAMHVEWVRPYLDQPGSFQLVDVKILPDQSSLVLGNATDGIESHPQLMRILPDGQLAWSYSMVSTNSVFRKAFDMAVDPSNGSILVLVSETYSNTSPTIAVVNMDPDANESWRFILDQPEGATNLPQHIRIDSTGSILVAGITTHTSVQEALFFQLTPGGDFEWLQTIGDSQRFRNANVQDVMIHSNLSIHACIHYITRPGAPFGDSGTWRVRFDSNGSLSWLTNLNRHSDQRYAGSPDGHVFIASGGRMTKYDQLTGDPIWSRNYSFSPYAAKSVNIDAVMPTPDGGIMIAGSWTDVKQRPCLLRISPQGTQTWYRIEGIRDYNGGIRRAYSATMDAQGAILQASAYGLFKYSPVNTSIGTSDATLTRFSTSKLISTPSGNSYLWTTRPLCQGRTVLYGVKFRPNDPLDYDEDGLPNEWEFLYSGSDWGIQAQSDYDGDGYTALQEYHADTNPFDESSSPPVPRILHDEEHRKFILPATSPQRLYTLMVSTNLLDSPQVWNPLQSSIPGTGTNVEFNLEQLPHSSMIRTLIEIP